MRKRTTKTEESSSSHMVPFILEFERQALSILKDEAKGKEQLKEMLKDYAARYARQSTSGA